MLEEFLNGKKRETREMKGQERIRNKRKERNKRKGSFPFVPFFPFVPYSLFRYLVPDMNSKLRVPWALTGAPLRIVGLKTHLNAASTAASRRARWPLTALASMTWPVSEIVILTLTVPRAFIFLAFAG